MKRRMFWLQKRWASSLSLIAISALLTACGEYWDGGAPVATRKMTLGRRVVNLVVGDRYEIPVIFEPDTLSNRSVWWQTENSRIAVMEENTVVALSEGLTLAYALSVSDHQTDSCWVNVLPPMFINPRQYPYDMVIYADVDIHGHHYTAEDEDSLIVGAFIHDELRGIGKMRQWDGKDYMEIRIWNDDIDVYDIAEIRCYYMGKGLAEVFPEYFPFDGNAHGTLSDQVKLYLDDNALEYFPWDDIDRPAEPSDTIIIDD